MPPSELSDERTPGAFAERAGEVGQTARVLNDYLRETGTDVAGSLAAQEHARESSFADEYISDPVFHVLVRGQQTMVAAADHMLGLAACIEAEDVVLAPMSLLRPIVVAAGMAYYVFDPEVSLRERLRRGWNFELESVREQLNSIDRRSMGDAWRHETETRTRYLSWATAHGYGKETRKQGFGEPRYWLTGRKDDQPPPSEIRLAEAVLAAVGDGKTGQATYRLASAFIHTRAHAFTIFLPAVSQYDPQTPGTVPLGMSLPDLTTWLMVMVLAVHTAAARFGHYFGWDLGVWVSTVHPILASWGDSVGPAPRLWLPNLPG